ncbi:uncharacterized protein LOC114916123 [Cajanus cajan]|uniref:uncharacterized protein LOC114916123 n=1 Tax=Cajanus cajan TaxID=3821 RepID=UPI0010FAF2F2|nr:uncharacterized protein LOC114916123 [Cajanus cajan]
MREAFLAKISHLDLGEEPELEEIWLPTVSIPNKCFSELVSLTVVGCQFLSDAVLPSHLLPLFTELETLEVRKCDYVKTIFDVSTEMTTMGPPIFPLEILTLSELPNLENIWNGDPHGILSVRTLTLCDLPKFKYNGTCCTRDATTTSEV